VLAVQQEDCSIHEVLGQRNCGRRSLFWCKEQSVGRSEWIEDAGWQLLTSAHSMSEGSVDPIVSLVIFRLHRSLLQTLTLIHSLSVLTAIFQVDFG